MPFCIPHTADIPFTLVDGTEIIVKGVTNPDCHRFSINLCSGRDLSEGQTTLHFNPRFDQNVVVRNCKDGEWFVVKNQAYEIFVDNKYFADFVHRIPREYVHFVHIKGDTQINDINFSIAPVPFKTLIPGGIWPWRRITVRGTPTEGPSFNVNLLCGPNMDSDDIALHIAARFNELGDKNQVVRNVRSGGEWGTEEREQKYFPFAPYGPFEMVIQVKECGYQILVNNQAFADFKHSLQPVEKINYLIIQGGFKLTHVKIE